MAFSQNGYLASAVPKDFGGLNNDPVLGTSVSLAPGVRADEVGDLLRYVARRFHLEVEPLRQGWCWGYAYRAVRAGTSLSNHSSATAVDLNAPNHPLGQAGTFSKSQVAGIRRILASCTDGQGPLIRWGGDYSTRKDEMHFEVTGSAARVRAHMRFLSQPAAPVRPPPKHPAPVTEENEPMTLFKVGGSKYRAICGDRWIAVPEAVALALSKNGLKITAISEPDGDLLAGQLLTEG